MNPTGEQGFKGFRQGYATSARTLEAMRHAIFRVRGQNGVNARWENGALVVEGTSAYEPYPFEITAQFDNTGTPTVCLVTIAPGTLTGMYSPDGSYLGKPIFEGSGGAELDEDPIPEYNIGVTELVTWFYFEVTTDKNGLIKTVWINAVEEGDIATECVDVPYVQEDFPAIGDPGNDGTYFFPIGYASVEVTGSAPNFVTTVRTVNTLQSSVSFWTCGGAGVFGGIAPA